MVEVKPGERMSYRLMPTSDHDRFTEQAASSLIGQQAPLTVAGVQYATTVVAATLDGKGIIVTMQIGEPEQ